MYSVAYEGLATICSKCGLYGHLIHNCPTSVPERRVVEKETNEKERSNGTQHEDDGFMVVRRGGRQVAPAQKKVVFAAGGSWEESARNLREIPQKKDALNIEMANRFENLEEDTSPADSRDMTMGVEENKENTDFSNLLERRKSIGQGRNINIGGVMDKVKKGVSNGPTYKRAGLNTNVESVRQKTKQQVTKPMKGLIFGPLRGDIERSASGKRLRVEKGNVGRSGGPFTTECVRNGEIQSASQQNEEVGANVLIEIRLDGDAGMGSGSQMVNAVSSSD